MNELSQSLQITLGFVTLEYLFTIYFIVTMKSKKPLKFRKLLLF